MPPPGNFQPNSPPKNARVASGSGDRISKCTTGCAITAPLADFGYHPVRRAPCGTSLGSREKISMTERCRHPPLGKGGSWQPEMVPQGGTRVLGAGDAVLLQDRYHVVDEGGELAGQDGRHD